MNWIVKDEPKTAKIVPFEIRIKAFCTQVEAASDEELKDWFENGNERGLGDLVQAAKAEMRKRAGTKPANYSGRIYHS